VPGVEDAGADRLGQAERQAGLSGVDAQQDARVRGAGHRHAVLRLGVIDAVPAGEVTVRRARGRQAAAQHLRGQFGREPVAGPAEQVHRDQRHAAHRVDVRKGIGGGDPPERVGVVHHGGEEVGGHHHRQGRADPHDGAVVAVLDPYQQVRARALRHEPGHRLLQLTGRDLASTAAAARVLGEPDGFHLGHAAQCNPVPRPFHGPAGRCAGRMAGAARARVTSAPEASGCLVAPPVFKTGGRRAAPSAGSIPVRLRIQNNPI
jgi:hypothetical protein